MRRRFFTALGVLAATACAAIAIANAPLIARAAPILGTDVSDILSQTPYFSSGFRTDQYSRLDKQITDSTATTPAALGTLVIYNGTIWQQSAAANVALPALSYGFVTAPAATQGGLALIQSRGAVQALVTTGSLALPAGACLVADGSGNLKYPDISAVPSSGSATPQGTTGAATVTYLLYDRNQFGVDSGASAAVTTTTANATLSPANSVRVDATVPALAQSVIVVRSAGGPSQGVIASVPLPPGAGTQFSFLDVGYTAGAATYTRNTTPSFAPGTCLAMSQATLAASTSTAALVAVDAASY
jgi:hypothetical protein